MKMGIIIGVLIGIAIAAIAAIVLVVLNFIPVDRAVSPETAAPAPITSVTSTSSPSPSRIPTSTPPTATPASAATPAPSSEGEVYFSLNVTEITTSGLSATVTAKLTNTGTGTSHNTRARIEVFSQGSTVKINSQDYIVKELGTITAGATKTTQITMSFSLSDGARIMSDGASVKLTVTSDEKTQTFSY